MLEVWDYPVTALEAGSVTRYDGGRLIVDATGLRQCILEDPRIANVGVELAKPGTSVRIIHVLDAVVPVAKADGPGVFPGINTDFGRAGTGVTHRMRGITVLSTAAFQPVPSLLCQEEGIVDLAEPGAGYSPLSSLFQVVLSFEAAPEVTNAEYDDAVRRATLKVAEHLAASTRGHAPAETLQILETADSGRIPVVHICEVATFGVLLDTLVYGVSFQGKRPIVIPHADLIDGAVVCAEYNASNRNLTWGYQEDPVWQAVAEHEDWSLAATILIPIGADHVEKETNACMAAKIAASIGAQGALVTAGAGGNAHIDALFSVRACEQAGIPAGLLLVETAGRNGEDLGLVDMVPEATLMISTGNREAVVDLPACEQVIGGAHLLEHPEIDAGGAIAVQLRQIIGANHELGAGHLAADVI